MPTGDRFKTVLAYLQFAYTHSTAFVALLGVLILLMEGRKAEAATAFLAAMAALADPRKPEPTPTA